MIDDKGNKLCKKLLRLHKMESEKVKQSGGQAAQEFKIYRKHWIVYISSLITLFLLACLYYSWLHFDIADSLAATFPGVPVSWFSYVALGVYLFLSAVYVYRILYKASMKILLADDYVIYRQGILPWSKWSKYWKGWRIFQSASSVGFFEWIFNKSEVNIIDTEGVTRDFRISNIAKGKICSAEINDIADRARRKS